MNKEDSIYYAKLAEQAERYDDMVNHMKKIATVDLFLFLGRQRAYQRRTKSSECCLQKLGGDKTNSMAGSDCN